LNFKKDFFTSSDGKTAVSYKIYAPENPKAVIQLSHGMCEYVERYAPHAEFFVSQGFVFAGNDHLGHGNTAKKSDDLGYTVSADCLVEDVHKMTEILKSEYKDLPVFLLGHSMGSFVARCYLEKYGNDLAGVIISGTAGSGNPTGLGKLLCKTIAAFKGDTHRSELVKSISTGSYSKKFGKDAPASAWVTSNAAIREKYDADPLCKYTFTLNGYYNMFDMLGRVSKRSWANNVPKTLPVILIGGTDDPVGGTKGITEVYERLKAAGVNDLEIKLFDGARHELFNEVEPVRDATYELLTDWINERIK